MDYNMNPLYHPYRAYFYNNRVCSYGYPPIHFEHIDNLNNTFEQTNKENIFGHDKNRTNMNEEINPFNKGFNFDDIISVNEDRLSILGFSINIDDLIILITLFTMFKNGGEIDYLLVIILGILLFSQD